MRSMIATQASRFAVERAKTDLALAIGALATYPIEKDALALAILKTSAAMLELVKADSDHSAKKKVEAYLLSFADL